MKTQPEKTLAMTEYFSDLADREALKNEGNANRWTAGNPCQRTRTMSWGVRGRTRRLPSIAKVMMMVVMVVTVVVVVVVVVVEAEVEVEEEEGM